uniref:Integrase catalytic domain-containing protein n=1 Tax=Acrobeloides nanus TaxID=290746 RepID=A0A914CGI7_9BILA
MPKIIYSDNAKGFLMANKVLMDVFEAIALDPSVTHFFVENSIQWINSVEKASWQGGTHEKLVDLTKRVLRKVDWKKLLTFDEFYAYLKEIECLLNQRPLTRISGSKEATYQLHGFCDGSAEAFATSVFIRCEEPNGETSSSHLVFAKAISSTKGFEHTPNGAHGHLDRLPSGQIRRRATTPSNLDRQHRRPRLRHFMICRRYDAKPFKLPLMPSLTAERTTRTKTYEYIGIDNWGPVSIIINSTKTKAWGVLITCLTTRMTYLDIATNLSTFTHIQLIAKSYAAEQGIEWRSSTTNSPWPGEVYEVMVKLTKNCLERTIGKRTLNYNTFITLLAQTKSVLNSRPLTYMSDDLDDCSIIRPIDFVNYKVDLFTSYP